MKWAGLVLQGMGVVFSTAASADDGDMMLCALEAVQCLSSILHLPQFPSALGVFEAMVTKPSVLAPLYNVLLLKVGLLESILRLGVACFSHTHLALQPAVLAVLACVLQCYGQLEDTQGNKKKLFTATCGQLLCPALELKGRLLASPPDCGVDTFNTLTLGLEAIFKSLFKRYSNSSPFISQCGHSYAAQ